MKNNTYQWATFLCLGITFLFLSYQKAITSEVYLLFTDYGLYDEGQLKLSILYPYWAAIAVCFTLSFLLYKNKLKLKVIGLTSAIILSCWAGVEAFFTIMIITNQQ